MNTRSLSPDGRTDKKTPIICSIEREPSLDRMYTVSNLSKNESRPVNFDKLRPNRGLNALTERVSGLDIIELLMDGADLNMTDNKASYFVPDLKLELKTLFNDFLTSPLAPRIAYINRFISAEEFKKPFTPNPPNRSIHTGRKDYLDLLDVRFTQEYDGKEYKIIVLYGYMNFMRVSKVIYKRKSAKGYIKKRYITLDFIDVEEFKEPFTPNPLYFKDLIPVKNMKKPYYIREEAYEEILEKINYA